MKRLKIVEQIIIVLIISVFIPFVTIGIIISNVSQQSVRSELTNNTTLIAQFVGDCLQNYVNYSQAQLNQIASSFNYMPETMAKIKYFDEVESKSKLFKNLDVIEKKEIPQNRYNVKSDRLTLISPIDKGNKYYLSAEIDINIINKIIADEVRGRKVYVFNFQTQELIFSNSNEEVLNPDILKDLKIKQDKKKIVFGSKKNTPKAYYKLDNPDWFVVVDTTKKVTAKTITKAKIRIILALSIAAFSIIFIVCLYTYYLYINIRQLFKGITAISKGNYDKKIHLIKRAFTPHEIVFLAKEFNYMAKKINVSYKDLKKKNKELKKLNEFRENLVSATSHEFRTPLTSIIGYSSRLLRKDIVLDDDTKVQSLQIIKQQAQRLSKMVEDLLVIPELESLSLKFNIEEMDLAQPLLRSLEYLKLDEIEFETQIDSNLNYVYADDYRLEQIFINLIDNAMKYSKDNAPVEIIAKNIDEVPTVIIKNKCEKISDEIKEKLFDKFIRADSNLTRTTRGTGLGLYIVKGLCENMKIEIGLKCDEEFELTLKFNDYVK